MRTALIFMFILAGCGVKGAPMPRRDEAFIKPSDVVKTEKTKELDKKKLKTSYPYKEDPR